MASGAEGSANRIRFLDVAKGIGILMVTFGHITELDNPVDCYMSLYKITIFYVISGYLIAHLNRYRETSCGTYLFGVFRHIGLPYILFSAAAIGVRVFEASAAMKDIEPVFQANLTKTLTLEGIATLWFLPTIFFSQIILFIIVKNSDSIIGKVMLASTALWPVLVLLLWNVYLPEPAPYKVAAKSMIAVWFMAAGFIYRKYIQDRIDPRIRFLFGVLLSALTFWLSRFSRNIDFNMMIFGDEPWVFFAGGLAGSLGLIMFLEGLEHIFVPKVLEYFGKNSLILMCAQRGLFFLNIIKAGWEAKFGLADTVCARFYIERLAVMVLLLFMTAGLIGFINSAKRMFDTRFRGN